MGFISFLENNMLSCQWKEQFDLDCLGCGMQRSLVHIIKGEFIDAFIMYPAIYTLIFMFAYLIFHIKYNFKKGSKVLLYLFITNVAIMLFNYIIKLNIN